MNEEVLKETAETTETTEVMNNDTADVGASDIADTGKENDFEFSETESNSEGNGGQEEKPSTKEEVKVNEKEKKTNSDYARERREAERKAELERVREETRVNAIIDALGGLNPYTGEKMEDKTDVEEYLTMKEIEKSGKDPITDFSSFQKQKAKEQAEAARKKKESEEWVANDIKEFKSKHPDTNIDELLKDELFVSIAKPQAGKVPMTKIYEIYSLTLSKIEEKAVARTAQAIANQQSSIGALKNTVPSTPKSVEHMTREERDRLVERARMGERVTF